MAVSGQHPLDQSATMALMDAIDSRVEELTLGNVEMAELLGRYDGQGKCRKEKSESNSYWNHIKCFILLLYRDFVCA